ncbi:MAG: ribbon-helix-helix protein, CopG family [Candidatus Lokiarchaeota archaeon]|nr:ribbon-helix-helix protein, CopG family [Candidatus Lokiarchaeota archaeon]
MPVVLDTLKVVTICMPESYVEGVDKLINAGMYPNRSEVIRIAIRDLLVDELWGTKTKSGGLPLVAQLEQAAIENGSQSSQVSPTS